MAMQSAMLELGTPAPPFRLPDVVSGRTNLHSTRWETRAHSS